MYRASHYILSQLLDGYTNQWFKIVYVFLQVKNEKLKNKMYEIACRVVSQHCYGFVIFKIKQRLLQYVRYLSVRDNRWVPNIFNLM